MKNRLLAFLILLVSTSVLAELSHEEFTREFVAAVEASGLDLVVEIVEPLEVSFKTGDGEEMTAFLNNAFQYYTQSPDELDDILDAYIASLLETMRAGDKELSPTDIVPVVKDDQWLIEMKASIPDARAEDIPEYFHQPLAAGLMIMFAEDTPSNIRYLDIDVLQEAGVDLDSIRPMAAVNLLNKLPELELLGGDGLYMLVADTNYEASLLVVDELWTKENFDVEGDIVVAVPARDSLVVSGTGETEKLATMKQIVAEIYADSPYFISQQLYVRRDDKWVPYP